MFLRVLLQYWVAILSYRFNKAVLHPKTGQFGGPKLFWVPE